MSLLDPMNPHHHRIQSATRVTTAAGLGLSLLAGAGLASAQEAVEAQALDEIGMLPHQKQSIQIPANERNPFDLVSAFEPVSESLEDSTLQAQRIMGRLNSFAITGTLTGADGKIKVLMSDMILEEGAYVPPVVAGQTERLKVTKISDDEIEITWIEEDDGTGYGIPQARVFRRKLERGARVEERARVGASGDGQGGAGTIVRTMGDLQDELSSLGDDSIGTEPRQ